MAKSNKKPLKPAWEMTDAASKRMVKALDRYLKERGIDAMVQELHLLPRENAQTPTVVAEIAAERVGDCPPPKQIRRVCRRLPNGTISCQNECV